MQPESGSVGWGFSYIDNIISLILNDELGKEVARVIDDRNIPAGTYEVRYDISHLSEGTYVYRFTLNKKSATSGRFVIRK